jgi:hypothetical protein
MRKYLIVHLTMELLFIYQLLAFYTLAELNALPSVVPFLILASSGALLYFVLGKWDNEKMPYIFSGISLVGLFLLGTILNYSPYIAFALSIVLSFRLFSSLQSLDDDKDGPILVLTTFVALVQYIAFASFEYSDWFVLFIFAQFFLIIIKKMIQHLAVHANKKSATWQLSTILTLITASILSLAFLPLLRYIFQKILIFGGWVVFSFIYPVLEWVSSKLSFENVSEEVEKKDEEELPPVTDSEENVEVPNDVVPPESLDFLNAEFFLIIFVIMALISFVLYVVFKGKDSMIGNVLTGYLTKSEALHENEKKPLFRSNHLKPPTNKTRRLLFFFERKLYKTIARRTYAKTVEEWFNELEGPPESKELVVKLYQKVRYGNQDLTEDEFLVFKKSIKLLQKEKYEKRKGEKKKEKLDLRSKRKAVNEKHLWRNT